MRILLVHEYYRSSSPSGEDRVFEKELNLLKKNGIEVKTTIFKNDWINTPSGPSLIKTALFTPWSPYGKSLIKEAIKNFNPHVVHFHNTFPVISQSALYQAKKMKCAVVQTFHNFRSFCAQALLMRNGKICEKCINRYPFYALIYKCYRNSFFATLPLFLNISLHRFLKTWHKKVDRFIVLSEFNKIKFIQAGFPKGKIRIKPNFFEDPYKGKCEIENKDIHSWIFVGRLKEEKGVQFLPDVWKELGSNAPYLHILGDGPYRKKLEKRIFELGLNERIILYGNSPKEKVQELLKRSSLLIFPSICYEGFPLVIGEAYSAGTAVAASSIGTAKEIVKDGVTGVHFRPGDIDDMAKKLSFLIEKPYLIKELCYNARKEYEKNYTPEKNLNNLIETYKEAIREGI